MYVVIGSRPTRWRFEILCLTKTVFFRNILFKMMADLSFNAEYSLKTVYIAVLVGLFNF